MSSPQNNPALVRPPSRTATIAGANRRVGVIYGVHRMDAMIASVTKIGNRNLFVCVWCQGGQHGIEAITGVTVNDELPPDNAEIRHYLGTADQATDPALDAYTADNFVSQIGGYTIALAYSVIILPDTAGWPRIAATIRGLNINDPRSGVIAWSDNPALCLADVIASPVYGMGRAATGVEDAANWCDDLVNSGRRYRIGGLAIGYNGEPARERIDLLRAYAGCHVVPDGIARKIIPDRLDPPQHSISNDDIVADAVITRPGLEDMPTAVQIGFTDTQTLPWREHPGAIARRDEAASGALEYDIKTISMPGLQDGRIAARIAQQELNRTIYSALNIELDVIRRDTAIHKGVIVDLAIPEYHGLFRVSSATNNDNGTVKLALSLEDVRIYSGEGTVTELLTPPFAPRSDSVAPPGIGGVYSGGGVYIEGADGTIHNRIRVDLAPPDDGAFQQFEIRFREKDTDNAWAAGTITGYTAWLEPVKEGSEYEFEVRSISKTGATSDWIPGEHTVKAKDIPPPAPTALTVSVNKMGVRKLEITYNNEPADFGGFRIEYAGGGGYFDLFNGLTTRRVVETSEMPSGNVTIRVRAEDRTISPTTGLRNASDWTYITSNIAQDADGVWYDVDQRIATEHNRNNSQDGSLDNHNGRINTENYRNNNQDGSLTNHDGRISNEWTRNNSQDGSLTNHDGRISSEWTRNNTQDGTISYHGNTQIPAAQNTANSAQYTANQVKDVELPPVRSTANAAKGTADYTQGTEVPALKTKDDQQQGMINGMGLDITNVENTANNADWKAGQAQADADAAVASAGGAWTEINYIKSKWISVDNLAAQNIDASQITSGSISADKISGGTLTGNVYANSLNLTVGGTWRNAGAEMTTFRNAIQELQTEVFGGVTF